MFLSKNQNYQIIFLFFGAIEITVYFILHTIRPRWSILSSCDPFCPFEPGRAAPQAFHRKALFLPTRRATGIFRYVFKTTMVCPCSGTPLAV